jgi:hypothetical protein
MFVTNVVRVPDMNFQENSSSVSQAVFLANVNCLPDTNSYENLFKGSLDRVEDVQSSSCKVPLILLTDLNQTYNFCPIQDMNFQENTVEPFYKDISLCDTSSIASDILWYQLIPYA